jgi:hypothetical protein
MEGDRERTTQSPSKPTKPSPIHSEVIPEHWPRPEYSRLMGQRVALTVLASIVVLGVLGCGSGKKTGTTASARPLTSAERIWVRKADAWAAFYRRARVPIETIPQNVKSITLLLTGQRPPVKRLVPALRAFVLCTPVLRRTGLSPAPSLRTRRVLRLMLRACAHMGRAGKDFIVAIGGFATNGHVSLPQPTERSAHS